jgi:hypothetical protein
VEVLVVLEQVPHGVMTVHAVQSQIAVQTIAVQAQVAVIAVQVQVAVIVAAGEEVEVEAAVINEANMLIFFVYFMGIGIGVLLGMVIERERHPYE